MGRAEKINNQILFTHVTHQPGGKKLSKKINFELSGKKTLDGKEIIYIEEGFPFVDPKRLIELLLNPSIEQGYLFETAIQLQFLFFYHNNWGEFMDAMIKDIIKENPSPIILRAIARTYKSTKELKKLEAIKKLVASASGPS